MEHRYFIVMQFNGTRYCGWQVQPNSPTIQNELNKKLGLILQQTIATTGAGRTDTGVHASCFIAHFDSTTDLTSTLPAITRKLDQFLSPDIHVSRIVPMHQDAHARYDAISRTYKYYISQKKEVFKTDFTWQVGHKLDLELMNQGAEIIRNTEDFTSFSKLHTDVKSNVCHIKSASWSKTEDQLVFTITADRFLRNMVRAIVGTLVYLGRNKLTVNDLDSIIASKNRSQAGESAPARGLFLDHIAYPYPF
ncbi:MAG: tRNA pseudouridine(38-40) synthase TruA [Bacteroidales bacterium]|nr:tRNA pseudouridine(38-40) synthase TruA [Bacteroidales bacterium]